MILGLSVSCNCESLGAKEVGKELVQENSKTADWNGQGIASLSSFILSLVPTAHNGADPKRTSLIIDQSKVEGSTICPIDGLAV